MDDDRTLDRFSPNPFERPNPFRVLTAATTDTTAELTARAAKMFRRAASQEEERSYRAALRELTTDPMLRAAWEVFTPHTAKPVPKETPELTAAADALGRLLLGGEEPHESLKPPLLQFAEVLGWDLRVLQLGGRTPDAAEVRGWWQRTTHVHADRWEYWHHLALLYHQQAECANQAKTAAESSCSQGRADAPTEPDRGADFWCRSFRCWARTLASEGLLDTIRGHFESMPGYSRERFDKLPAELSACLAGMEAAHAEQCLRSHDRLSAARHRRLLERLATDAELAAFRRPAQEALERFVDRLWTDVRRWKNNGKKQLGELIDGLLVIAPRDLKVLSEAFDILLDTTVREQTPGGGGEFVEALAMSRALAAYAAVLDERVFPRYPAAAPVDADVPKRELTQLYALHLVLCVGGTTGEQLEHHPYSKALGEALK